MNVIDIISSITSLVGVVFILLKVYNFIKEKYNQQQLKVKEEEDNNSLLTSSPYIDKDDNDFYNSELQKALKELKFEDKTNKNVKYAKEEIDEKDYDDFFATLPSLPAPSSFSTFLKNNLSKKEEISIDYRLDKIIYFMFPTNEVIFHKKDDNSKWTIDFKYTKRQYPILIQRSIPGEIIKEKYYTTHSFLFVTNSIGYYLKGHVDLPDIEKMPNLIIEKNIQKVIPDILVYGIKNLYFDNKESFETDFETEVEKTNTLIFDRVNSDLNEMFGTSQEINLSLSFEKRLYYRFYRIDNKRENILIQRTYNGKTTDEYNLYKNNIEHSDFYLNYQRFLDDLEKDRSEYKLLMLYKNSPIIPTKNFFAVDI